MDGPASDPRAALWPDAPEVVEPDGREGRGGGSDPLGPELVDAAGRAADEGAAVGRVVEVAVDAPAGPGPRTYTYAVPARLADVEPGEAVLVPFGKGGRQVLAIVLGEGTPPEGAELRSVTSRVRGDGPLLPPALLGLARWIASHYLAPVATVLRAMLPPGMLERLELVVEVTPAGEAAIRTGGLVPLDLDLLDELAGRPRPVRDLAAAEGRPALLRRLRALGDAGLVELTWTLLAAAVGPRYERRVRLAPDGLAAATAVGAGEATVGRPLGPRQRAVLGDLLAAAGEPGGEPDVAAAPLAARHGSGALAGLVRRGLVVTETRERPRRPLAARVPIARGVRPPDAALTDPQQAAVAAIVAALDAGDSTPLLLDGVTGGGKTAIYAEAIAASLERGRPVLVLVPEIALAIPLVDRLRAAAGLRVAVMHSGLSAGERLDEWRRIRSGDVDVVAGTRTALLAPLADLGCLIVDEEHDPGYKSDRTPRFQARDAALRLAALHGAALVLGSATPSVESVAAARDGRFRHVRLPTRPSGQAPAITLVDLREELHAGNRGLLSGALLTALGGLDTAAGDRAILVINRRGTASAVLCRDCGHVLVCPDCERPLVYHQAGGTLRCHHCGRATPLPDRCPACRSPRIRYLGGGTERLEREVRDRFPALRTARLDRDITERRGGAERVLDALHRGEIDVLVGTSLVTKALDVPEVTLVGVVSADIALNLPDERSAERTYQLVAQAVGRAGRGDRPGHAVIQTYRPDHRAIVAVATDTPDAFYDEELLVRARWGSPPFGRAVKLTVAMADRDAAERTAVAMADRLRDEAALAATGVTVAGPAPAYIARRAERWRFNIVLRGEAPAAMLGDGLPAPWSIDVDPESLL